MNQPALDDTNRTGSGASAGLSNELYPFKSNYFNCGGLKYHYLDEGKGFPVVMVHGNPTWSFYYRNLVKALRGSYRVIVPDHIGMGLSEKPGDDRYDFTATRRMQDLGALVDHLGLERFVLVGHDWGGIIGTAYVTLNPDRIAGMVMMNTAGFIWPVNKRLPFALFSARIPLGSGLFIRGLNVFARGAVRIGMKRSRMRPEVARGLLYPYGNWGDRRAVHRFIQDIPVRPGDPGYDMGLLMESRLKLLAGKPLLLCWGMKDFIFCGKMLDEWRRHFPEAEVHRFEDAGHYILEDAADEIVPLIQDFIGTKFPPRSTAQAVPKPRQKEHTQDADLASRLMDIVARKPDRLMAVHMRGMGPDGHGRYESMTYAGIDRESNRIAHGLEKVGMKRGMHTVLMVTPGLDFFAILAALLKIGAIPVLVDPGMGVRNLKKCMEEAEPEAFIGIPKAHLARVLLRWARRTIRINVTAGRRYLWGGRSLDRIKDLGSPEPYIFTEKPKPEDMAMLAFTSGNTGIPKGVVYTHGIFSAQLGLLKEILGLGDDDVDLATFPPFALFAPACGVPAVVPDMDATRPASADPRKLITAIKDHGCTNMFCSPALVDKIGRYCTENRLKLPTLRRVVSAGAPARMDAIERFSKLLVPGVKIYTPYGATEALPVTIIASDELLGETRAITEKGGGVCVGRPVRDMRVAIIPITEEPIPEWSEGLKLRKNTIGEIAVRGPVVTREYYRRPVQNGLAKIRDPRDGGVWHRMGDVGYLDEKGRLWMCGRKSHRVETEAGALYSLPCEAIFNSHPSVYRSALVGVTFDGHTEPVICVELEKNVRANRREKKKLAAELLAMAKRHDHTKTIGHVLFHPRFPVDIRHNAKILREKLAPWARRRLS